MKKKNIFILGGSLYGCLLAFHFSKKKKYNIYLFENSNKLITSLNSITLANQKFNNGYHIFELPRSIEILNFFKKNLKVKFLFFKNEKKNLFKRNIINYNEKLSKWPKELQNQVLLKKKFFKSNQNLNDYFKGDLAKLIKKSSSRFSDKFKDSKQLFLPHFLPGDIQHNSKDEGMIFRNKLKTSQFKSKLAVPRNFLFSNFQKPMELFLKKRGVKIYFKTQIKFVDKKIKFFKNQKELDIPNKNVKNIFFCLNSAIMLKDLYPEYLKKLKKVKRFFYNCLIEIGKNEKNFNFSEVLCLNDKMPNVNRISSPSNFYKFKNKRYLQLELFAKEELNLVKIKKNISTEIKEIFFLKNKPKVIDLKMTRTVYLPNKIWIKNGVKKCKNWIKMNQKKLHSRFNFFPINMNKTWIWAKEEFKKYY